MLTSSLNLTPIISALDNERSLWPLLVKDVIDNGGRSYMEYHRGGFGAQHAGRERLIEESATTAVWIGGRKVINYFLCDPLMRKLGLDPKVDISLLVQKHAQKIPTWISQNKSNYLIANILRFLVGTLIPVGIIGWLIPTGNQALTQYKRKQEEQNAKSPTYLNAPKTPRKSIQFSGTPLLQKVSGLINDEFWGNVAIDAGISGGRLYKARNWLDRLEIGLREASIVAFLYFLGDKVKNLLKHWFDQTQHTITGLTYDSIAWLKKEPISTHTWKEQKQFLKRLTPETGFKTISNLLNPKTGRFDQHPILELARKQRLISVVSSNPGLALQEFKYLFEHSNPTQVQFKVDPRKLLDITALQEQLIHASNKPGLVTQLIEKAPKTGLQSVLQKTSRYKGIAMFASYAISTGFIAWLTPMLQHWLTKKLTGSQDFPGIRTQNLQWVHQ